MNLRGPRLVYYKGASDEDIRLHHHSDDTCGTFKVYL